MGCREEVCGEGWRGDDVCRVLVRFVCVRRDGEWRVHLENLCEEIA